jgi:hypothetical protein
LRTTESAYSIARLELLLFALVFSLGFASAAAADDAKNESRAGTSQWGISIWGLSYHPDKSIDYDAVNWGLGVRYYARPQWRWLGKNQDNRVFLEGDALRNSNRGIVIPLSAGAEYRIGSAPDVCKLFAVVALTLAYYQNPARDKTDLKFGPVPGIAIGCGHIKVNVSAVLSPHTPLAAVVGSMTIVF